MHVVKNDANSVNSIITPKGGREAEKGREEGREKERGREKDTETD